MINFPKKHFFVLFLILVLGVFLIKLFQGLYPIPSDTIVGLYHPYRDVYAQDYPNGIPFKNFLITDPVRQTFIWKELSLDMMSKLTLPLWNPYEMAGKPLMGNFQSSSFYPLNLILFLKPFYFFWSIFIFLQIILAAIFMYAYLISLKLEKSSSTMGALSFSFSGFVVSWFEWGNIVHAALWLPLILLSIDKILGNSKKINKKKFIIWQSVFVFSLASSFLAGHLQIFFYILIFSIAYLFYRLLQQRSKKNYLLFGLYGLFLLLVSFQLFPTLQFISLSARGFDVSWLNQGWFIPWQHLIQFIFPDFFGNPATLNYWGVWNYAEFVGYIGILPLTFGISAIIFSQKKEKYFFFSALVIALIFSLQNPIAELPFKLSIPFVSSSQPTRLIFIIVFCLSVLGSFGFDLFLNKKLEFIKKISSFLGVGALIILIWILSYGFINFLNISQENLEIAKRNLIFPTLIFSAGFFISVVYILVKNVKARMLLIILLLIVISFDLLRFSNKFSPFTKKEYLFPNTKSIEYLKMDHEIFRVASNDSRIFPPNFLTHYKIQTVEGYDPLYLLSYGQLIAASERGEPNIKPPYGFNRIITPHNIDSKIIDLLNVKYVFSFTELDFKKYDLVFKEGQTKIYKNNDYLPRAFFVEKVITKSSDQLLMEEMFVQDLSKVALINEFINDKNFTQGRATIEKYKENEIIIKTENKGDGFMVFSDAYYPTWDVLIDGKIDKIYKTDFALRGVFIPSGSHEIVFKNKLF